MFTSKTSVFTPAFSKKYAGVWEFAFNAKENDNEVKGLGNSVDFGDRIYDPRKGGWSSIDKKVDQYPSVNPYCFALNTPIQAIDPNGKLVIFINGMHDGTGGRREYWEGIDKRIMAKMGDFKSMYFDGAIGGASNTKKSALDGFKNSCFFGGLGVGIYTAALNVSFASNVNYNVRMKAGEKMGKEKAAEIFANLKDGETIKIVAHSMGTAYSRGFVKALNDYQNNNKQYENVVIEYELDINSFNGSKLSRSPFVKQTDYISNKGDNVANGGILGNIIGSSDSNIPGGNNITQKIEDYEGSHSINDPTVKKAISESVPNFGTTDSNYSKDKNQSPVYEENPKK